MDKKRILVVEDESGIADTIVYALKLEGFDVQWLALGGEALEVLQEQSQQPFDFVILDVGLPDLSGFEVCKQIRQFSDVPILFLTARSEEIDRVVGLEIGADDYVVKPFSPRELSARVKVILRRGRQSSDEIPSAVASSPTVVDEMVRRGKFVIQADKHRIEFCGQVLDLTRYEYGILRLLILHPGRVYSREQLMELVWQTPESTLDRAVDTQIKSLRAKLRQVDTEANPVRTHRGVGYSLAE